MSGASSDKCDTIAAIAYEAGYISALRWALRIARDYGTEAEFFIKEELKNLGEKDAD